MKLSPSGESAMERVHSDALHKQKEMGWNRPRRVPHRSAYLATVHTPRSNIMSTISYKEFLL